MLRITELKKNTLIELDSIPFRVVSYSHTSMGRGGATVKVKIKNLINGSVLERTFKNDDKISPANLEHRNVQYLYSTKDKIFLMDMSSFDQIEVSKDTEPNLQKFFLEGSKSYKR
jgi:elongation factor P